MTSEKTIYLILDEVALMLYTFQSEDVFSVKINSFSEKFHKHFSLKTQKNSAWPPHNESSHVLNTNNNLQNLLNIDSKQTNTTT